jgi:hypothetical protein
MVLYLCDDGSNVHLYLLRRLLRPPEVACDAPKGGQIYGRGM